MGLYPKVEQSSDAMLQLALWAEFSTEAKPGSAEEWYTKIEKNFPGSEAAATARGALVRLKSEGKRISFSGKILGSSRSFDIQAVRGKAVLINFWDSENDLDFAELKKVYDSYAKKGFEVVNVNLDSSVDDAKNAVKKYNLPGIHLFEEGGKKSRLSRQLGIALIPTMILIGKDGKVVDRNIQLAELEKEVDRQIR